MERLSYGIFGKQWGQDFEELPESYVIFITRDDAIGSSLPIYHIVRTIRETDEELFQCRKLWSSRCMDVGYTRGGILICFRIKTRSG